MKLLLDENLSLRIVPFIQDSYPGSTQVALVGLERVNNIDIRQYAIDNDYIITTQDADFYEMGLIHGQASQERLAQDGQSIENGDHQNLAGQSANH